MKLEIEKIEKRKAELGSKVDKTEDEVKRRIITSYHIN